MVTRVTGDVLTADNVLARHLGDAALGMLPMINGKLVPTVNSNALTIALKTAAGLDPSVDDPVLVIFRNATLATGDYTIISVTAATSLVISSGSTLGTIGAQAHRLYVVGVNDAGVFRLGIYNPWDDANKFLRGISDADLYSSTAEGGAGAADSPLVLYTGTAVVTKAVRTLAYLESTQAVAGTWVTVPSKPQLMGPGVYRTGDEVARSYKAFGAVATGTTLLPADDTIPQITEGDEYMTIPHTPRSAINLLDVTALWCGTNTVTQQLAAALFQDAIANGLKVAVNANGAALLVPLPLQHQMVALTVNAITFRVRAGGQNAGTTTFNGAAGARLYGGAMGSFMQVREIFV